MIWNIDQMMDMAVYHYPATAATRIIIVHRSSPTLSLFRPQTLTHAPQ